MNELRRIPQRLARSPILLFLLVLLIPIAGTLISELVMFDLPGGEVEQLLAFMIITGGMTSLLSFAFYRLGILEWFRSLRWAIWMVIALLVLMIFLNVWLIARFTFIQNHYLTLTSLLLIFAGLVGADHRLLRIQNDDRPAEPAARCHPGIGAARFHCAPRNQRQ